MQKAQQQVGTGHGNRGTTGVELQVQVKRNPRLYEETRQWKRVAGMGSMFGKLTVAWEAGVLGRPHTVCPNTGRLIYSRQACCGRR